MSTGRIIRNALPLSNVVASGVATGIIDRGATLEDYNLKLGGTALTKAMLSLIRIRANTKTIIEATGSQLDKVLNYRGHTADAAYLNVPFFDRSGATEFDRMVGCLDTTQGIESLTSEITIAGATAPTLEPLLVESAAQKTASGEVASFAPVIAKLLRLNYNAAAGGKISIPLPLGPANGAVIKRIHIENSNVTGVTVKENSVVVHESLKLRNEFIQKQFGRTPQAGLYTVDFVLDGNMRKGWDTRNARTVELILDLSAADNGFILLEVLDTLGNL